LERGFERVVSIAIVLLGNSISFIIAFCLVLFWLSQKEFYRQDIHTIIGDIILGIAFLSLFIIQKSFNRYFGFFTIKAE